MKELIIPKAFEVAEFYTNDQIQYSLDVGNSGGIRPKLNSDKKLDYIVLTTSQEETKKSGRNPYADSIEGDILTYTGAGLKGEQTISGVNKRLLEQMNSPIPILGFIKEDVNKYKFAGLLFLIRHYEDYQLDHEGLMRKVVIFEFQIISNIPILKIGDFDDIFSPIFSELKKGITEDDLVVTDLPSETMIHDEASELKNIEQLKTRLMLVDPYKFEIVVSKLVSHVGFLDVKVTKKSGDEGVDVNAIFRNPISSELLYLFQVKRWKHSVGRNEVANLRGSMGLNNQGVIISTSHFTASAKIEASSQIKTPINLIGIQELYRIIKMTGFDIEEHITK
jgi:HJR/Mrr/RecB family endonuclease